MLFIPDPSAMLSAMDSESSLYYLIAGQSMFNYGVAYLLFGCFKHFTVFTQEEVLTNFDMTTLGYIIASLMVDLLAGGGIAVISALLAKFILQAIDIGQQDQDDQDDLFFLKPLVCLLLAAISYLSSLILGFSPIICLIVYGIMVQIFTYDNIELVGSVTVPSIINGLATVLEALLFF